MGYSDFTPVFSLLNLLVSAGCLKALTVLIKEIRQVGEICKLNIETSNETRDHLYKVTYGKPAKLHHLCNIVEKDDNGEWGESSQFVRVGSDEYREALAAPGLALRHRSGQVEEGNQC